MLQLHYSTFYDDGEMSIKLRQVILITEVSQLA